LSFGDAPAAQEVRDKKDGVIKVVLILRMPAATGEILKRCYGDEGRPIGRFGDLVGGNQLPADGPNTPIRTSSSTY
jgi:hypothetical protein